MNRYIPESIKQPKLLERERLQRQVRFSVLLVLLFVLAVLWQAGSVLNGL